MTSLVLGAVDSFFGSSRFWKMGLPALSRRNMVRAKAKQTKKSTPKTAISATPQAGSSSLEDGVASAGGCNAYRTFSRSSGHLRLAVWFANRLGSRR